MSKTNLLVKIKCQNCNHVGEAEPREGFEAKLTCSPYKDSRKFVYGVHRTYYKLIL